ncbi:hypothetical protein BJ170DRAFT_492278 [Xylariales sp. AK1849]|nr:hypothetical protein BJ170DRAFT_492278 [Xylariales sp. AK1849]
MICDTYGAESARFCDSCINESDLRKVQGRRRRIAASQHQRRSIRCLGMYSPRPSSAGIPFRPPLGPQGQPHSRRAPSSYREVVAVTGLKTGSRKSALYRCYGTNTCADGPVCSSRIRAYSSFINFRVSANSFAWHSHYPCSHHPLDIGLVFSFQAWALTWVQILGQAGDWRIQGFLRVGVLKHLLGNCLFEIASGFQGFWL